MNARRIQGLLFALFGVVACFDSWRITRTERGVSSFDAIGPDRYLLIMSLLLIGLGLAMALSRSAETEAAPPSFRFRWPPPDFVIVGVILAIFIAVIPITGFLLSTLLFFLATYRLLGHWPWPRTASYALVTTAFFYVVFVYFSNMSLPKSLLGL